MPSSALILAIAVILAAAAYLVVIHHGFWTRHRPIPRIAVHIRPAHEVRDWAWEGRNLLRSLAGIVVDQPRALPLAAAILTGSIVMVLALDPVAGDPILWGRAVPPEWRAAVPGWLKGGWVALVLAAVLGHCIWIFLNAPRALSRHWLLLHQDGAITAAGAELPRIDPARPVLSLDGIAMPAYRRDGMDFPERSAAGAVLVQDGQVIAFVANPINPGPGDLRNLALTAPGWWRVDVEHDFPALASFLRRHHPPSGSGVAPGWDG